ncbi:MAG: DNA polymerase III subunit delta' [Pseudomonadota bacterium]
MADAETYPEADRLDGFPHPRETQHLYGQHGAERLFLDAWQSGRMHHAWLLRGPKGVGKATLAYRAARAMIADPGDDGPGLFGDPTPKPETLDAPEDCAVQARIEAQAEPRLFVLRRQWDIDKKRLQTQIAVEHVRALRRFLQMSAADGGWRAVIVDSADEMNRSSANALLKYLEEPPARTLFLLISHAPAGLLPTIRSRCRTLDLAPLIAEDLSLALQQTGAEPPSNPIALAELSSGSVGAALQLTAEGGLTLYAGLVKLMANGRVDRPGLMALSGTVGGAANAGQYRAVLELTQTLLARLARTGALQALPPEAAPGEHALMSAAARDTAQARLWAEALSKIAATTRHALAVNLDPQQTVIDMFLEIDATLGRVRAVAA